ncbi:hypothetical protein BC833DRAFT_594911 [Globomyces pollinis-pini]|nr:hypothetical protein BC833DRAFT_594911 [Globomyces pollinis-pini]
MKFNICAGNNCDRPSKRDFKQYNDMKFTGKFLCSLCFQTQSSLNKLECKLCCSTNSITYSTFNNKSYCFKCLEWIQKVTNIKKHKKQLKTHGCTYCGKILDKCKYDLGLIFCNACEDGIWEQIDLDLAEMIAKATKYDTGRRRLNSKLMPSTAKDKDMEPDLTQTLDKPTTPKTTKRRLGSKMIPPTKKLSLLKENDLDVDMLSDASTVSIQDDIDRLTELKSCDGSSDATEGLASDVEDNVWPANCQKNGTSRSFKPSSNNTSVPDISKSTNLLESNNPIEVEKVSGQTAEHGVETDSELSLKRNSSLKSVSSDRKESADSLDCPALEKSPSNDTSSKVGNETTPIESIQPAALLKSRQIDIGSHSQGSDNSTQVCESLERQNYGCRTLSVESDLYNMYILTTLKEACVCDKSCIELKPLFGQLSEILNLDRFHSIYHHKFLKPHGIQRYIPFIGIVCDDVFFKFWKATADEISWLEAQESLFKTKAGVVRNRERRVPPKKIEVVINVSPSKRRPKESLNKRNDPSVDKSGKSLFPKVTSKVDKAVALEDMVVDTIETVSKTPSKVATMDVSTVVSNEAIDLDNNLTLDDMVVDTVESVSQTPRKVATMDVSTLVSSEAIDRDNNQDVVESTELQSDVQVNNTSPEIESVLPQLQRNNHSATQISDGELVSERQIIPVGTIPSAINESHPISSEDSVQEMKNALVEECNKAHPAVGNLKQKNDFPTIEIENLETTIHTSAKEVGSSEIIDQVVDNGGIADDSPKFADNVQPVTGQPENFRTDETETLTNRSINSPVPNDSIATHISDVQDGSVINLDSPLNHDPTTSGNNSNEKKKKRKKKKSRHGNVEESSAENRDILSERVITNTSTDTLIATSTATKKTLPSAKLQDSRNLTENIDHGVMNITTKSKKKRKSTGQHMKDKKHKGDPKAFDIATGQITKGTGTVPPANVSTVHK